MRIRPYIPQLDFDTIETWNIDERTHALWCARILPYPVERESFHQKLEEVSARTGDTPFVMTSDDGNVEGFFSYSLNLETNEGMLKFVMVAPDQRGKGLGQEMLKLAAQYAFASTKADAVRLVVFSVIIMIVVLFFRRGIMGDKELPDLFSRGAGKKGRAAK